jgi:hypothetical protein
VAARGELLQALGILVLEPDDDRQLGIRVADVGLDVAGVDRLQVRVEVAGLRVRVCPGIAGHVQLFRIRQARQVVAGRQAVTSSRALVRRSGR